MKCTLLRQNHKTLFLPVEISRQFSTNYCAVLVWGALICKILKGVYKRCLIECIKNVVVNVCVCSVCCQSRRLIACGKKNKPKKKKKTKGDPGYRHMVKISYRCIDMWFCSYYNICCISRRVCKTWPRVQRGPGIIDWPILFLLPWQHATILCLLSSFYLFICHLLIHSLPSSCLPTRSVWSLFTLPLLFIRPPAVCFGLSAPGRKLSLHRTSYIHFR